MTLRSLSINLELGQEILVGHNDEPAKITKIEYHEKSGEVTINTTKGTRKALTFKLAPTYAEDWINPADKYR
jgi:riboflavin synthase alpha subunit